MKLRISLFVVVIAIYGHLFPTLSTAQTVSAQLNMEVTVQRVTMDREQSRRGAVQERTDQVGYRISINNRSFRDLEDLDVEYTLFVRQDHHGARRSDMRLVGQDGTTTIEALRNLDTFTFETDPVELSSSQLDAGWVYTDGSKRRTEDAVAGLTLRILHDGELLYEMAWPSGFRPPED